MKKWIATSLSLLLVLFLAACGPTDGKERSDEGEKKLADVSVMLDWYPNAVHSFLYVAKEKGYFQEEGVNVDIQYPANPTDPLNLAAAGKVTIGFYYQPDVIMARANENVPVKAIGAIVRSPLNYTVFLDESPIQSPKDLEGKTIGYPGIPLNEALLSTIVEHDGGNPDKVKLIDVGFDLVSSVATKKTDAVIGAFINHEVPVLESKGNKVRYFDPTKYGVPNYYELVAVTGDKTWENDQEAIKAFWRAASKGYEFMKNNPDEALEILLNNQDKENYPLDKAIEQESMKVLLPKMETDGSFGEQTKQSWQDTADWLKKTGLIKETPNVEEMFVNVNE
jgi:putative hydroxymethylpyrimidine transport system substrate-binding protein